MIFTERTITVVNDSATINKPLILYRGDKNIELKITIAESQFKFRNTDASNVIETTDASYAQLVINTPYNSPIFSDVAATKNGAVIFVITEAMIDEIREVGAYEIQIRLLDDNKQSRASIPPVSNAIEIREPIAIEDGSAVDSNAVNVAKVNRALTTTSAPLEAFDSQGNYIKNNWGDGDPITDAALNKMEAGIDGVNKKIGNVRSQIKEKANDSDLAVERKRIDSFISLAEGSTTGDAELIDGRIGADGVTYDSIGSANRTQFSTITDCLVKESAETIDKITGVTSLGYSVYQDKTHGYGGSDTVAKKFYISGKSEITVTGICGGNFPLVCFFSDDNGNGFISSYMSTTLWTTITETVAVPAGAKYCIVNDVENNCPEIKCEIKRQTKVLFKPEDINNDILKAEMQDLFIREYDSKGMDFKPFDKHQVVLVVDDGSAQTPDIYRVCHELGVPMSVAVPWNRLSEVYTRPSNPNNLTIKDFCKLIEKDGGEVLSHGWTVITDSSTEEDYIDAFVTEKKKMQENGFACRGKILIGGANYISNDPRTDRWVKLNYEYSDLYGLKSSKMYYLDRLWFGDWLNLDNFKGKLNEIKNETPKVILLSMHGSDDETKFEHAKNVKGLLEYMKTLDFVEFTTIAKVYDEYAYAKFK